jgi:hypothetical protein
LVGSQSKVKSDHRIVLVAHGQNAIIYVEKGDLVNKRGAEPSFEMQAGTLPAPAQDQGKAFLPQGAFPANLRGTSTSNVMVTDSKGNYIPISKRISLK